MDVLDCGRSAAYAIAEEEEAEGGRAEASYSVRHPKELGESFLVLSGAGLAIFALFLAERLAGGGMADGRLASLLALPALGCMGWLWASRWRVDVDGDRFTARGILSAGRTLEFSEVDYATMDEMDGICVYKDGRRAARVGAFCENAERFETQLYLFGKMKEADDDA